MKTLPLGSIISGTLLTRDLLDAFTDALQQIDPAKALELAQNSYLDSADALEELHVALNRYCAPFTYFGSHAGNDSEFGVWIDWDYIEDCARIRDGIIKVDAGDDWPPIPDGVHYVLEVNDHGNATLFDTAHNEIWSCV